MLTVQNSCFAECRKTQAIRQFTRGSSTRVFSSNGLGWSGLLIEQHEFLAGDIPEAELNSLLLCLWSNTETSRCDHPDANGNFVPKLVQPGTLSLYTSGALPAVRPWVLTRGLLCAFDEHFLFALPKEIRLESNVRSVADGLISQDKRCFMDRPLQRILEQLGEEARTGGQGGPLVCG